MDINMNIIIINQDIVNSYLGKINPSKSYKLPYTFFYIRTLDNQLVIPDFEGSDYGITGTVINMDDSNFSNPIEIIKN